MEAEEGEGGSGRAGDDPARIQALQGVSAILVPTERTYLRQAFAEVFGVQVSKFFLSLSQLSAFYCAACQGLMYCGTQGYLVRKDGDRALELMHRHVKPLLEPWVRLRDLLQVEDARQVDGGRTMAVIRALLAATLSMNRTGSCPVKNRLVQSALYAVAEKTSCTIMAFSIARVGSCLLMCNAVAVRLLSIFYEIDTTIASNIEMFSGEPDQEGDGGSGDRHAAQDDRHAAQDDRHAGSTEQPLGRGEWTSKVIRGDPRDMLDKQAPPAPSPPRPSGCPLSVLNDMRDLCFPDEAFVRQAQRVQRRRTIEHSCELDNTPQLSTVHLSPAMTIAVVAQMAASFMEIVAPARKLREALRETIRGEARTAAVGKASKAGKASPHTNPVNPPTQLPRARCFVADHSAWLDPTSLRSDPSRWEIYPMERLEQIFTEVASRLEVPDEWKAGGGRGASSAAGAAAGFKAPSRKRPIMVHAHLDLHTPEWDE